MSGNSLEMDAATATELAKLARDLSTNPKTRKQFLRMTREVRPEVPMPEIDAEDASQAALKSANEQIEAMKAEQRTRDAKDELKRRRDALIANGKASADEIESIEKLMLEKKIPDHETAAEYFRWMKQAEAPAKPSYQGSFLDKGTRDTLKPFFKNANQAARETAAQALADIRSGRVRFVN